MNTCEQFTPYVYLGVLILLSAVALILLASIAKGLFWDKGEPGKIIVADKEGGFFFDAKDMESITLKRQDGGGYVLTVTKKYKHGYWPIEYQCESRERGIEMIAAIKSILPKVETV